MTGFVDMYTSIHVSVYPVILHPSIHLGTVRDGDGVCRLTSSETEGVDVYTYDRICRYVSIYTSVHFLSIDLSHHGVSSWQ